jgi:malate dehydrogenase (oxaloacetate-decarboxylating)(NADP+)
MNPYKDRLATDTLARTLEEACDGADVLIGLSKAGAFSEKILRSLNRNPIIFAMANPEPEIRPEIAK